MRLQYLSILLVVLSSLFYHICQKSTPSGLNPLAGLIVTYACALVVAIIAFFIFTPKTNLIESVRSANWASFILGFAVVGLELGFLLSYRVGWNISVAGLVSNTSVAVLLIPIGLLLYREKITFTTISGALICIVGLLVISKK